ncbi:MAG: class I SAM-dependent methyltransferase [Chloroflexi bacterium]|nr:class I SAM-dependent methyltransferase [Chloroflexota bacterium]
MVDNSIADHKALVEHGYDRCAGAYAEMRQSKTHESTVTLKDHLDDGAAVLDVGCGAGVPVARDLARSFYVTGVDISGVMIDRARINVPQGIFMHADIMSAEFPPSHFDAVVAYYSIVHLPREEHQALFHRIHQWLKPGGYLMATVGMKGQATYTNEDFFGVKMIWSNYGLSDYMVMLDKVGFNILAVSIVGHGYGQEHQMSPERHPLLFAQKRT